MVLVAGCRKPLARLAECKGRVVVRIPLELLSPGDPATWDYTAVVMSQEGFPSAGVRRIRDVETIAPQWRLGGGPAAANHTRTIDVAFSEVGTQEALFSGYSAASSGSVDAHEADDLPLVPMVTP